MKPTKRGDAWRAIGNKLLNAGRIESGLCAEIERRGVPADARKAMSAQLLSHLRDWAAGDLDRAGPYLYRTCRAGRWHIEDVGYGKYHEERAMGCYWMALEADEEDAA